MISDVQKASLLKRFSAFLLDIILLVVLATGMAFLLSAILQYDKQEQIYQSAVEAVEEKYDVKMNITRKEYDSFSEEKQQRLEAAKKELIENEAAMNAYGLMTSYILLITTFSILVPMLLLEFVVPLLFKHGRTVGKKVFGIAVMQSNGVKVSSVSMFVRSILGKYVLETMIPVYVVMMILFRSAGLLGTIVLALIAVAEVVLLIVTKNKNMIHDVISYTTVVDFSTQRIFDSADALVEYQKQVAAERAQNEPY